MPSPGLLVFRRPLSVANMCATAVFRLEPRGRINVGLLGDSAPWESTMWRNKGRWKQSNESEAGESEEVLKRWLSFFVCFVKNDAFLFFFILLCCLNGCY